MISWIYLGWPGGVGARDYSSLPSRLGLLGTMRSGGSFLRVNYMGYCISLGLHAKKERRKR